MAAVVAVLVAAGCGSSSSSSAPDGAGSGSGGSTSTTAATDASGAPGHTDTLPTGTATIDTTTTPLGAVLVDGRGFVLYTLSTDAGGASPCVDACAAAWPPLTGTGIGVAEGVPVKPGEFTLVARPDGSTQVAVNGHPLYRYAADTEPGQTGGQGVAGVWFVVGTDGTPITG